MAFATVATLAQIWRRKGLNLVLKPKVQSQPQAEIARAKPAILEAKALNTKPLKEAPPLIKTRLTPEQWPAPWQELLKKVKPGKVVWTYAELGQDLLQQETPGLNARRKFLGGLLQAKPTFPQGTHTFWPYSLPLANGSFETSKELFWSGVRALGGRVMIALGPKASQYLLSSAVVESARHVEGVLCFSFADIPVLAQDPQVYQRLLQVLRYALNRSFPNLFA